MADSPTSAAGPSQPSSSTAAASNGFRAASSFLPSPDRSAQTSSAVAGASLRNASNGADEAPVPATSEGSNVGPVSGADGSSSSAGTAPAAPVKPVNRSASSKKAVVYSSVQRRNPVLQELQRIKQTTEIGDIPADYQVGEHAGLLFLSLKYHRLHPEYIHGRIEKIKNRYTLRIMMVLCDVNEHQQSLKELSKVAIINDLTMMVAWSNDEVAQYIAQFKMYEHKSADTLKEKVHQQYRDQLQHVLTTGKRVNKTDANNLASQFGSFANIVHQQAKALAGVKGLGKTKVETLVDAFHKPFLVGGLKRKEDGGEADALTSDVAGRPVAAVPETGLATGTIRANGAGSEKGKHRAPMASIASAAGQEREEVPGSPDWPDEIEDDDDDQADDGPGPVEQQAEIQRRRARMPSRSPGLSPELLPVDDEELTAAGAQDDAAWRDPLDDDDDAAADADEPATKRARR